MENKVNYWTKLDLTKKKILLMYLYLLKTEKPDVVFNQSVEHRVIGKMALSPHMIPDWVYKMTPRQLEIECKKLGSEMKWLG